MGGGEGRGREKGGDWGGDGGFLNSSLAGPHPVTTSHGSVASPPPSIGIIKVAKLDHSKTRVAAYSVDSSGLQQNTIL